MAEPPKSKAEPFARPLPKRFYKVATAVARDGSFALELDGRQARTPLKRPLTVPTADLGAALEVEWQNQSVVIDPATMPLTRLVTTAIDAVAGKEAAVREEIVKYSGTDLICYRADGPEALVARQAATWDPVLTWASQTLGTPFVVTQGLMHVSQPAAAPAKLSAAIAAFDALDLAALHTLTTLTGSSLLAFATARGRLTLDEAWSAAHVDEDWQIEQWGRDAEAEARRAYRYEEARAAARILAARHKAS